MVLEIAASSSGDRRAAMAGWRTQGGDGYRLVDRMRRIRFFFFFFLILEIFQIGPGRHILDLSWRVRILQNTVLQKITHSIQVLQLMKMSSTTTSFLTLKPLIPLTSSKFANFTRPSSPAKIRCSQNPQQLNLSVLRFTLGI